MVRLTAEEKQFYKDNGYIKLSNIFTEEEMDEISSEYKRLFIQKNNSNMETAWEGDDVMKLATINQVSVQAIHNLQFHSATFSRLIQNENLLDALEDVMETPNILLHHTKAHDKPPGKGAPYPMHQDYLYFPYKNHSMVAAFLHVNDCSPENGGLCVYPGSHKLGPLEDHGIVGEVDVYHYADPKKYPVENATPIYAKRGDVVIFSYLLLHGSYVNLSDRHRRMFLIQLMAAEDEPVSNKHRSWGQGYVLRGRNDNRRAAMDERFQH